MSSPNFSINVLKNSIKITMEPPKGLKLNLLRQYNNIKDQDLEACSKPDLFKTFFFSMCFFHIPIFRGHFIRLMNFKDKDSDCND